MDLGDISLAGDSSLLELPMTIMPARRRVLGGLGDSLPDRSLPSRAWKRLFPALLWLRPNGRNRLDMLQILDRALEEGRPYVEFMLHSSELMPGGSPTFPTVQSIEGLFKDLDALFSRAAQDFSGATLSEFDLDFRPVLEAQRL